MFSYPRSRTRTFKSVTLRAVTVFCFLKCVHVGRTVFDGRGAFEPVLIFIAAVFMFAALIQFINHSNPMAVFERNCKYIYSEPALNKCCGWAMDTYILPMQFSSCDKLPVHGH